MEKIKEMLFIDEQDAVPVCFCEVCGGARYGPSLVCIRCERTRP